MSSRRCKKERSDPRHSGPILDGGSTQKDPDVKASDASGDIDMVRDTSSGTVSFARGKRKQQEEARLRATKLEQALTQLGQRETT